MKLPEHHLANKGYAYVDHAEVIGATVSNTDVDGVYLVKGSRTFLVALNGQWPAYIEYGLKP